MSKFPRRIDVIISTWIRLSKSMKSRRTFHMELRRQIDGESAKMCLLGLSNTFVKCRCTAKVEIFTITNFRKEILDFGMFCKN